MARAVPESPAAGRVLALAGGVDRVIAAVCQVIILVTTIVLLGVLGANVVARYAFGGGGLHWVSEVPEQLFPWRRFAHAVIAAGVATGVVMLVIMASAVVGWIMTFVQAPQLFATWAIETLQTPWLIILAMIGIMLVAGMFIDLPAAILLLGPISPPAHYGLPPGFSIDELCARHPGLGAGIRAEVRADSEHRRDRTRCRWSR